MPVTRSEGRGRKNPSEQKPSASEDTTTSATDTTTATGTTSTATGTTATETTQHTDTSATSALSTVPSASTAATTTDATLSAAPTTSATVRQPASSKPPTEVMTDTSTIRRMKTSTFETRRRRVPRDDRGGRDEAMPDPPPAGREGGEPTPIPRKEWGEEGDRTLVPRLERGEGGETATSRLSKGRGGETAYSRAVSKRSGEGKSTQQRSKTYRITKAKENLLKLQIDLATTRLAALEAAIEEDQSNDDDSEDEASIYSKTEANERVGNWLNNQVERPILAITNEPHRPSEERIITVEQPQPQQQQPQQIPAGAQPDLTALANAITCAVRSAQRPKFIELPFFNGSHQEWLPFRAAYYETENAFSTIENINRFRRNLKGKAKEAVEGLLITSAHPSEIMKTLESRFGRPDSIAMMEIEALRGLPRLTESPRDICIFATKIANSVATLRTLGCYNYMYNPEVSKTVIEKLTPTLRYRYYDYSATQPKEDPDLIRLNNFLKRESELCGPYALPEHIPTHPPTFIHKKPQKVHNVIETTYTPKCPVCDETGHNATNCEKFKKMNENSRWDTAKSKRLCFRCLRYRTKTHSCRGQPCGVNGCKFLHHKMLHYTKITEKTDSTENKEPTEIINSAWTLKHKQSYLKIIPVQIAGPKASLNTFALMDDGSTVTLIDSSLAERIGVSGPVDPLKIETINDMKRSESTSRRVVFTLKGLNNYEDEIQARTIKNLHVSSQRVSKELIKGCKHLTDISEHLVYTEVKPQILIGQDNWHLLLTSEVRKGGKNQPVASLTPLGWVLHGSETKTIGRSLDFVSYVSENKDDSLDCLVKQYFEMDSLCINPRRPKTDPEEQALRILEKTTTKITEGRFQTGLLWRKEDVTFPNNYENSLKRLYSIEKKIDRDPALKQKYNQQMDTLIKKGYAELAPTEKIPGKTWYLPHFGVVNPMKPEKLRVVHDAAARTQGVSLNDMLLKGPDLLQSLPGVVMRFRQHEVAVTADIKEMFMQVKLRSEDRDALRYLWRGERRDQQPPEEYRMTSLIFGASSSPSTAIYIKNLNASQHESTHPEAAAAIVQKHYVDDYLDSFRSLEDAVRITHSVREVHSKAGFELKQWKSNSPLLIQAVGENENTENSELYKSDEQTERVLGVIWKISTDELTFNLNWARIPSTLINGKTPTKREALRIVMSLFDPLGFASPVTIRAKQLLQEVWRRGTQWDDDIDEDLATQWKDWIGHLKNLSLISIPRRYLHYSDALSLELHVFTDASESAYSTVLYWRAVTETGDISLSLIMAKARVAPLKLTSIPRLELQAAVLGTRLANAVIHEHERKPDRKYYWTDSKTVLTWIRTGSRSYKPYVSHRLAAIEENSTVNEWRWVPTKMNVSDDATRDVPAAFNKNHRWYRGPDFLYEPENTWPTEIPATQSPSTGEERIHHLSIKNEKLSEGLPNPSNFSSWDRLRYATARVLQFINQCRPMKHSINYKRTKKNTEKDPAWRKIKPKEKQHSNKNAPSPEKRKFLPVTAETLRCAEELLMRSSQEECFAEEIENNRNNKTICKESRLNQLSVEYKNGAIRLRSRIHAVQEMSEDFKSPMVLDGNHTTVKLWIQSVHRRLHHAGVEATVNECRQQYWILRLRPITRVIIRQCLFCRMKTQTPPHPRTGDLPACRLAHHKRPFTFTGVDYFGPLSITVGRARQKRYVAMFTCLTTRAIHMEIAGSLSTDSAIMALRRMIARRGCPTEIWSDNGTNLKAADKELRLAIDRATADEAAKRTISWRYIPPAAPFMGGAWERMIRSVKSALTATLHEKHPTEEVLSTLLAEVEYTVNSRPLTHVSTHPDDPEALTPNHFLLGGHGHVPQPGTFTEQDCISRSSWRAAQRLADVFWSRWVKEYLPELQHRREPHGRGAAVQVGDLVQIVDNNLPRNVWIRGRVIATYPGPDNVVRTVDVKTKGGVLRRPVRKLIILPVSTDIEPAPT